MSDLGAALLAQLDEGDLDALASRIAGRLAADAPPESQLLLSPREVADQLKVSPETIRRAVQGGLLDARRVGRAIRISPAAVEAWTATRAAASPAPATRRRGAAQRSPMRDALRAL